MTKELDIDNYYDGYKTSDINCVDLPIAASAGYFNRDYYYFYCLCYSYILNWGDNFNDDWYKTRESILALLGLSFSKIKAEKKEELFSKVIHEISVGSPVFLVVKYGSLFYSRYYKWGTYDHGLIISDFNDEYKTFGIRDREVVREHIIAGVFTSDVMHKLQIDDEMLYKIWKESNKLFLEEESAHYNNFYSLKGSNEDKEREINIKTILIKLLDTKEGSDINQFEKYIYMFSEKLKNKVQIANVEEESVRRRFHRSFITFFNVVKKYIWTEKLDDGGNIGVEAKLEVFLRHRLDIINMLHLYSLRSMVIPNDKIQGFIKKDYEYFCDFKYELLNILKKDIV